MSSPTTSPPQRSVRFSPRDWSLRVKLAVVLLVPAILAVVLGGFRIADQAGQAAAQDRVTRFAAAQGEVGALVERMQQERYLSAVFVAEGRRADPASLSPATAAVDTASTATAPDVVALFPDDAGLVAIQRQSEQALARLPALRNLVATSNAPASAVISRYSDLIGQLVVLDGYLLRGATTPETGGLATALQGLSVVRDEASLQVAIVTAASRSGEPAASSLAGLAASDARLGVGLDDFRSPLTAGQRVAYGALIAGASNTARERLVQVLLATPGDDTPAPAAAAGAAETYQTFLAEIDAAAAGVRGELTDASAASRSAAIGVAWISSVLLLLALLIGAVIVGLIARTMLTSLRTLRRSALDVAQNRLPDAVRRMREGAVPDTDVEPVPISSREEIGEVARAFDAVHTQAVRLAAEQATLQNNVNSMFVNLSRRSQTLVDRQLRLIEELENNEEDADQLSNLFRLDHLATRMRRNSENLLVLAGTDLTKRASQHVPVVDVLRAAVSEIEQYERVTVEQPPDVTIAGRAANDLQHLLAELLDNATSFSPPASPVTMTTSRTPDGKLVVEITDQGIGMPAADLGEANGQLGRRSEVTLTTSRRMGLFVVGRLAARHGVAVRLASGAPARSDSPGLTARVTIPYHLVVLRGGGPGRGSGHGPGATATPHLSAVPPGGVPPIAAPPIAVPPQRVGSGARHSITATNGTPPVETAPDETPDGPGSRVPIGAWPHVGLQGGPDDGPDDREPDRRADPQRSPQPTSPSDPRPMPPPGPELAPRRATPGAPAQLPAPVPSTAQPAARVQAPAPAAVPAPGGAPTPGPATPGPATPGPAPMAAPVRVSAYVDPLFAPGPSGARQSGQDGAAHGRTPIFEEVASGWFRSYRAVPINWQADPHTGAQPPDDLPPGLPASLPPAAPPAVEPVAARPEPGEGSKAFATAADDGWQAAVEVNSLPEPDDRTSAGLPLRTPGARLLAGRVGAGTVPARAGGRDARAVRARLGDYQRGVREGRDHREPGTADRVRRRHRAGVRSERLGVAI